MRVRDTTAGHHTEWGDSAVTNPDTTDDDGRHSAQGDKQTEVPIDPRDYERDDDE